MKRLDVSRVIEVEGEWVFFRQAGDGYPALWMPPLPSLGKQQPSGRWHLEGQGYAQYFASDEDASWAELVRKKRIRTEFERRHLSCRLWKVHVEERNIADLSTFDLIEAANLDPAQFVDDDHHYCQALADALIASGFRGVLAPSAACAGAVNLTLFGSRRECKVGEHNPRPDHYVACRQVADRAAPPAHILEIARYYGEPHLSLEAWQTRREAMAA